MAKPTLEELRGAAIAAVNAATAAPNDAALVKAAADAEAALAAAEAKAAKAADRKVRVLVDTAEHAINSVLVLSAEAAAAAVAEGWGDDSPAAVAYAESIAPKPAEG